jgi:hypothetical protein
MASTLGRLFSGERPPEDLLPNVTGSDCFMDALLVALLLPSSCTVKCWLASNEAYEGVVWKGGSSSSDKKSTARWPTRRDQLLRQELRRIQQCLRSERFCGDRCRATLTAGTMFARGQQDPSEWLMHLLQRSGVPSLFKTRDSEIKTYESAPPEASITFHDRYVQPIWPEGSECGEGSGVCRAVFPVMYRDTPSPNLGGLKEKVKVTDYVKGNLVIFTSDKLRMQSVDYYDRVYDDGSVTLDIQDYKKRPVTLQLVAVVCWTGGVAANASHSFGHYTCFVLPPSGEWHFFDDLGGGFKLLGAPPPLLFSPEGSRTPHPASGWDPATTGTMFFYTLPKQSEYR